MPEDGDEKVVTGRGNFMYFKDDKTWYRWENDDRVWNDATGDWEKLSDKKFGGDAGPMAKGSGTG